MYDETKSLIKQLVGDLEVVTIPELRRGYEYDNADLAEHIIDLLSLLYSALNK